VDRRLLTVAVCLLAVLAIAAACGSPASRSSSETPSSTRRSGIAVGAPSQHALVVSRVCGVTALGGGPPTGVGVRNPGLLHECPSGPTSREPRFVLVSSTGKSYPVTTYDDTGWSAIVPSGTYRATGMPGCRSAGPPFAVRTGTTLLGIIVWWGCDYL
jgi:hypothetical protein